LELKFSAENRLKEYNLPFNLFKECDIEILRSLVIYGRNSAGKSNILKAFKAITYLIENSDSFKHDKKQEPYEPFLFDNSFKNAPVKFEIEFISIPSKIKFKYQIEFSEFDILKESLYFYPEGVIAKLYDRNKYKITYGDYYKGAKKKIEDDLLNNQLFLSKASRNKIAYLDEVYLFFTKYLYVSTVHYTEYDNTIIKIFTELSTKNEKLKFNLLELLKAADTNIQDFTIGENKGDFKFPLFSRRGKRANTG
jgi:AAA15 family ATPase/GTPase